MFIGEVVQARRAEIETLMNTFRAFNIKATCQTEGSRPHVTTHQRLLMGGISLPRCHVTKRGNRA